MDTMEMIRARHSVRKYLDKPLPQEVLQQLQAEIDRVNRESGLHIQYTSAKDGGMGSTMLKLIGWRNVQGSLVMVGPAVPDLEEQCGYWGEHLVLFCQHLGLNTCWAGMARLKNVGVELQPGEEYVIAIGVGYGANQGRERKSKTFEQVTEGAADAPDWFRAGIQSALLAPTAVNQQKFTFRLEDDGSVTATAPSGNLTQCDLGIVKYHFEAATGVKVK